MSARKSGRVWLVLFGFLAGCATGAQQTKPVDPRVAAAKEANAQVERLFDDGKYQESFEQAKVVAEQVEASLGPDHLELAEALTNLAASLYYLQRTAEAHPLMERALAIRRKAFGPEHPLVAESMHGVGAGFLFAGDKAKARALFEAALEMRMRLLGPEDEAIGDSLIELGYLVNQEGDTAKAVPMYEKAIAIWKKALGPEDKKVGQGLLYLGLLRVRAGQNAEALKSLELALPILDKTVPATHPELIESLRQLAQLRWLAQNYQGARPLFLRLLEIQEKLVGPYDPVLAQMLDQTGYMLSFMGDSPAAEKLHRRALGIHEKANGPEHKTVADSLHGLGGALLGRSAIKEARKAYERSMSIYLATSGPESTEAGHSFYALGRVETALGRHQEALALYERAQPLLERGVGKEHQEFAMFLTAKAETLMALGRYFEARQFLVRAYQTQTQIYGAGHPYLASTLASLGNALTALGDMQKAYEMLWTALNIVVQAFGKDSLEVARYAVFVGNFFLQLDEAEEAIPFYEHSLGLYRKHLGPESFAVASTAHNLAHALAESGRFIRAIELYDSVLEPFEKALGKGHPWIAQAWCARSIVRTFSGYTEPGLSGCRKGLEVLEQKLGPDHPHLAQNRNCLLLGLWAQGNVEQATSAAKRSLDIAEKSIDPLLDMTSEREKLNLVHRRRSYFQYYLSLASRPADVFDAYERVVRWKGLVANSLASQRNRGFLQADPSNKELMSRLSHLRRHLAELMFSPVSQKGMERLDLIGQLTIEKEGLERQLSRVSTRFRDQQSMLKASVKDVCNQLGRDDALVDFVSYGHFEPPKPKEPSRGKTTYRLIAFVLKPGACGDPIRVELGEVEGIDQSVEHYRKLIASEGGAARLRRQAKRLYQILWEPLEGYLGGVRRVWLVPDGSLNSLPFGALVNDDGSFLTETITLNYLASAKDLLEQPRKSSKSKGALLAGGIDFGGDVSGTLEDDESGKKRFRTLGLFPVSSLPQTRSEVDNLSMRLRKKIRGPVVLLKGKEATETRVTREMAKKRFIHVATHGFFATGPLIASRSKGRLRGQGKAKAGKVGGNKPTNEVAEDVDWCQECLGISEPEARYQQMANLNPMVLSGILLAGANEERAPDQLDDGILTAEEIAGLDLNGTELVTLSACETGMGEVLVGEGVLGMRRSFALAGVRALLMSLWKVPDKDTRLLMEAFYKRILRKRKVDKAEALRQAQLEMIERLRKETGYADPRSWAAFIISGR